MATYNELIGKRVESFSNDPNTSITYTVTVASSDGQNRYFIDGVQQKQLRLYEGVTYNFDYSAASSHPFRFSTTSDGTHGGGSEYTTGVTVDSNITTIVVATGAPNLFYYCSSHSGMGSRANTPTQTSVQAQMWYNQSNDLFKTVPSLTAWSSASPLVVARAELMGAGLQTAALAMGGYTTTTIANTEEFNGSGWSTQTAMPGEKHKAASGGTQTAAFVAGGYPPNAGNNITYEYDGSSWTTGGTMNTGRRALQGAGTLPAGLAVGGYTDPPGTPLANVEEYDGTNWANATALPAATSNIGAAGLQTAAVAFGGYLGPLNTTNAYQYDGSSWTATGSMNTARSQIGCGGIQTSAMAFGGGAPSASTATELYDGSTWTTSPASMATAKTGPASAQLTPSNSTGLAFGGSPPGAGMTTTEEWNVSANVVTSAAWAASGNLNNSRSQIAGFGATTNASIGAGGYRYGPNVYTNASEEYDGSSFSNTPNMPVSLGFRNAGGTVTAGIVFGGHDNTSPANTSLWDGSSYSNGPNIVDPGYGTMGNGSQTALFMCGSSEPARPTTLTEEYNGSSWSSVPGTLNTGRGNGMGVGSQTAGLAIGGGSPNPVENLMEEYNGSTWTVGHTLVTAMSRSSAQGGSAPQDNTMIAGGNATINTTAQTYDGTTWATTASLGTGRTSANGMGAGKDATSMIAAGGNSPSIATSEEFTASTTAMNVKTLTQS